MLDFPFLLNCVLVQRHAFLLFASFWKVCWAKKTFLYAIGFEHLLSSLSWFFRNLLHFSKDLMSSSYFENRWVNETGARKAAGFLSPLIQITSYIDRLETGLISYEFRQTIARILKPYLRPLSVPESEWPKIPPSFFILSFAYYCNSL